MTTDALLIHGISPAGSVDTGGGCGEVDAERWDELWSLLASPARGTGVETAAVLPEALQDEEELEDGPAALVPVILPPPPAGVMDGGAAQPERGEGAEEGVSMSAGHSAVTVDPMLTSTKPAGAPWGPPVPDGGGAEEFDGMMMAEDAVSSSGARQEPALEAYRERPGTTAPSVHSASEGDAGEHSIEPEIAGDADGRPVISPSSTLKPGEPTVAQGPVDNHGVSDEPNAEDGAGAGARALTAPARPGSPDPDVREGTGPGEGDYGSTSSTSAMPPAPRDEPDGVLEGDRRAEMPARATIHRPSDSFVHLRVRDTDAAVVDIRLRADAGNLAGRLHTGDAALMRDLSAGLDSLRRDLGDLGYDDVHLNLTTDGHQHPDTDHDHRQDTPPRGVTRLTSTGRPGSAGDDGGRGLVNVLA